MILAWLGAAFVAGVVAGASIAVPGELTAGLVFVLLVASWLLRRGRFWPAFLVLAALCAGWSRSPVLHPTHGPGDLAYYNGASVTLHGVITAEPDIRDTGSNYVVAADTVTVRGTAHAVSGRVQIHTTLSQQFDYGDEVSVRGVLLTPPNTSRLPYRDILARKGIGSEMRFPRMLVLGKSNPSWLGWLITVRLNLEHAINSWLPEPEAALLVAITLGAHSASLGDLTPILIATGLIHVIAISGIKVALVAGTIHELAKRLQNRVVALVLPLGVLICYVLLTGATPSGVRSGMMWSMVFLASYLGRRTVALVSLGFVAALMVVFDPTLPWDIGFQMSTFGTLFIVAYTEPIVNWLRFIPSPFREAFSVSTAAQVGTLPITIVGFHVVSVTGLIANALVLPLLPMLIALGFALGLFGTTSVIAAPAGALCYVLLRATIFISRVLGSIPVARPPTPSPIVAALYYLGNSAIATFVLKRAQWVPVGSWSSARRELVIALVLALSTLSASLVFAADEPRARLYWLGNGQAKVIRAGGQTILIDGSPQPFKLLEQLDNVLPYSKRSIDLVVVTDPRSQNIAGLQAVLAHYSVGEVLDVGAEYPTSTYAAWRASLRAQHIPVFALRTGLTTRIGPVRIDVLGPDGLYPNPIDCVGLIRFSVGGRSTLLLGSASRREQEEALFRPVNPRSDVLLIENRSVKNVTFLRSVHPSHVVSRNGRTAFPTVLLSATELYSFDL